MRYRLAALSLLCLLPAAAPAQEASPFHSLESVLQAAYLHNPQLRADRAAFRSAEEDLPQAEAGYKPTVTATGSLTEEHLHADGPTLSELGNAGGAFPTTIDANGNVRVFNGQVSQPLYRGGQTTAAIASARSAIAAQRSLVADDVQQIMLQVATAYMNVVRDQLVIEADEANVADLAEQYQATNSRFQAGSTTRTDLAQAEAAQASAQSDLIAARGALKTDRATFEQLAGFAPGTVAPPRLSFALPATLDAATEAADAANPQIKAAIDLHESSASDVARLRGVLLPQFNLVGAVAHTDNPAPGLRLHETSESAGLQASWTLYAGGADRSRIRQADDTANQRLIDILTARRQIRQQVVSAWENLAAVRAEIVSRTAEVDAARLAAEGTRAQAEVGSRSVLDSLDSEQLYRNARVALVQAQRDETVATFALAGTLGLLQPAVLGFPEIAADDSREGGGP